MLDPPLFPAGEFTPRATQTKAQRRAWIETIKNAPAELRKVVKEAAQEQLDRRYRNWTVRQIVHHLADSHMHSYVRFKWAMTESEPLIKAYDESAWSNLTDARTLDVEPSLLVLDGLHRRWTALLLGMRDLDFERAFKHPESGEIIQLSTALPYYAWHGRHHTAQIEWTFAHGS